MTSRPAVERKIWVQPGAGSLSKLEIRADRLTPPLDGHARIRIHAIGLNFADVFACLGLYSATPKGAFTPGLKFAGEIEEVAAGREKGQINWKKGDRCMGLIRFGAYATHLNADMRYLYKLPRGWSYEQGAAFLAQGITAYYAIHHLAHVKRDENVLVQSAAGGVGLLALFILKHAQSRAIAVVGNAQKAAFLKEKAGLSESAILIRNRKDFASELKRCAPDGLDVALDAVYGEYFQPTYDALRGGGRYVLFGAAELMPAGFSVNYLRLAWKYLRRPRLDPLAMISENKSLLGFNLIWLWDRVELLRGMFDDMMRLPWEKNPPHVGERFAFENAVDAMRFFQSGKSVGKIVLTPDHT